MKIAYLGQMADVSTENGISKKIAAQGEHWMQAGHEVRYFSLVPATTVWPRLAPLQAELVARGGTSRRMFRSLALAQRIRAWRPDVIYFRYAYHSAGFPALLREFPTVAEINSDDLAEYPLTLSTAKVIYHRLTRGRILRAVAGFVFVTHELQTRFTAFKQPSHVIANGISLDEFAEAPPPSGAPVRLVFIGTRDTPWHGLERVVELAGLFPEVAIEVIGTESVPAPPTVRFHGSLSRERYEPLLQAATAAIGTMGLFKKQMEEACPLKVREYLALGLPVIAAYRDTDVPEDADYFLRLPNDAKSLAPWREHIASFLDSWRQRRVSQTRLGHLDYDVKEKRRLEFMAQIADAARTHR